MQASATGSIHRFSRLLVFAALSLPGFLSPGPAFGDCPSAPIVAEQAPPSSTDCAASTEPGTQARKECCARQGLDAMGLHLCERRKKLTSQEAGAFHESFTNPGAGATAPGDRLPIVFLPGIAGTNLLREGMLSSELWPLAPRGDRADLALEPDGKTSARAARVLVGEIMRSRPKMNFYGGFLDSLTQLGYREGIDLFAFGYDWRCSNDSHFGLLDEQIDSALASSGKSKVILAAHSMGGLIARGYVYSSAARAAKVDAIVTMGTPYWGSAKVYYAIANGYDFGNPFIRRELMKILAQNWPSAYQLLPQVAFIPNASLEQAHTIRYKCFKQVVYSDPWDHYELTETNDRFLNPALLNKAQEFFSRVGSKENPARLPGGIKQYAIVGTGVATVGSFDQVDWPGTGGYVEMGNRKVVLLPKMSDGDGSVPLWSAETKAATATYYVPYQVGYLFDASSAHGDLPANKTVQSIVARLLKGSAPAPGEYPPPPNWMGQPIAPKELENVAEFVLHSDAHLRISHASGVALGFDRGGAIEESLPGTILDMDGVEYAALADLTQTYKVELNGIREGKFTLEVHIKRRGSTPAHFSYEEVAVKNGTYAYFYLTPGQISVPPPPLTVTADGKTLTIAATAGTTSSSATGNDFGLDGIWLFRGIDGQDCIIRQSGTSALELTTEKGVRGTGQLESPTSFIADFPFARGLRGTLNSDRTRIDWSNGEWWSREGSSASRGPQPTAPVPPSAVTPPTPPPPSGLPPQPGSWRLVGLEQMGSMDDRPATPGDGGMRFDVRRFDSTGGEVLVTVTYAVPALCSKAESESILFKWIFPTDIRYLQPGQEFAVDVSVEPFSQSRTCPTGVFGRSEVVVMRSEGAIEDIPMSQRSSWWPVFTHPYVKDPTGVRLNFYVGGAPTGRAVLHVNDERPPMTSRRGSYSIRFWSNACCGTPPPLVNNWAFHYVYEY